MTERILIVDDDPNILRGYKRQLRSDFEIDTAPGGEEGLIAVSERGPYAVIVSDMRMPGMDGVQFLSKATTLTPDTVRMMLTGNADQQTAIDAVNEGNIFRFLCKPCPSPKFAKALRAGIEQHRLVTAERELLRGTLAGTVNLLAEVLALQNPKTFGRVTAVQQLVHDLCCEVGVEDAWAVEMAATVCQIGCVVLPDTTLEKVTNGERLSDQERQTFDACPEIGRDLVSRIPRLEKVAEIMSHQAKRSDGSGLPVDGWHDDPTPLNAQILSLAQECVTLRLVSRDDEETLAALREPERPYAPWLVDALASVLNHRFVVQKLALNELSEGMVFQEDILTKSGDAVLVPIGRQVTPIILKRLESFAQTKRGVREPIRVRCAADREAATVAD